MESNTIIPTTGNSILIHDRKLIIPNNPIIPYIEGDGIGSDISPVMIKVVNAAVKKAYNNRKKICWIEVYAGAKSISIYGDNIWLPRETIDLIKKYKIAIKGPLTTPVGKGIRSLNVALRQKLDLYICQRPISYYEGAPSPMKYPEKVNMVIFRENSEDIYAGIEWAAGTLEANKVIKFLIEDMHVKQIKFTEKCAIGIKTCSEMGSKRLIRAAIKYAITNERKSITLVHKGNIMKFTEGGFKEWGYELVKEEFNGKLLDQGPWMTIKTANNEIIIKDIIADAFLQQILLNPSDYDVIACMNLNGDYISDALAAQVGGIGIAPGANIGNECAVFEPTHGTAPKYVNQDKVNPSSIILSAEMMLRYMGWYEAANLIKKGIESAILHKNVTYDFARLMVGANLLTCSEFGNKVISYM